MVGRSRHQFPFKLLPTCIVLLSAVRFTIAAAETIDVRKGEESEALVNEEPMSELSAAATAEHLLNDINPAAAVEVVEVECIPLQPELLNAICTNQRLIKRSFNAWGGKRSQQPQRMPMPWFNPRFYADNLHKRGNFNPWGGKRDAGARTPKSDAAAAGNRRVPFNPWGGKR